MLGLCTATVVELAVAAWSVSSGKKPRRQDNTWSKRKSSWSLRIQFEHWIDATITNTLAEGWRAMRCCNSFLAICFYAMSIANKSKFKQTQAHLSESVEHRAVSKWNFFSAYCHSVFYNDKLAKRYQANEVSANISKRYRTFYAIMWWSYMPARNSWFILNPFICANPCNFRVFVSRLLLWDN